MILSRRRAHEASCPRSGDGGISSQKITIGWPQLQAVYPHHWAKSQWGGGVQRQTRVRRKQRVQCLKGLPLKINEKYTEISHLWSGKFAWKAQGAIFCLTESNWSNSLRRKGGWSLGKEKKCPMTEFILVETTCGVAMEAFHSDLTEFLHFVWRY